MILKCACKGDRHGVTRAAQFQDDRYGAGRRVHTPIISDQKLQGRCTICEATRPTRTPRTAKKAKANKKDK